MFLSRPTSIGYVYSAVYCALTGCNVLDTNIHQRPNKTELL